MKRALPLLLLLAGPLWGAGSGSRGTSVAPFLRMDAGARAAGMGDVRAASADDADAVFGNPAALTQIPSVSLTAFRLPYLQDTSLASAAFGRNLGPYGAAGAGLQYMSGGASERTNDAGVTIGSVSPRDSALSAGYAYRFADLDRLWLLNGFSAGASLKRVSSRIVDTGESFAVDAGLLSKEYAGRRLRWAVSATNLTGAGLMYGGVKEPLPREVRLGAALRLSSSWRFAADAVSPRDDRPFLAAGGEFTRDLGPRFKAAARLGYNTRWQGSRSGTAGVSAGFGVMTKLVSVDYFARFEGNGWLAQGLSLSWGFGARFGLPPHVRELLAEARRLADQNRFAEAVLKYNEALVEEPSCREAKEGLEEAARQLR